MYSYFFTVYEIYLHIISFSYFFIYVIIMLFTIYCYNMSMLFVTWNDFRKKVRSGQPSLFCMRHLSARPHLSCVISARPALFGSNSFYLWTQHQRDDFSSGSARCREPDPGTSRSHRYSDTHELDHSEPDDVIDLSLILLDSLAFRFIQWLTGH